MTKQEAGESKEVVRKGRERRRGNKKKSVLRRRDAGELCQGVGGKG